MTLVWAAEDPEVGSTRQVGLQRQLRGLSGRLRFFRHCTAFYLVFLNAQVTTNKVTIGSNSGKTKTFLSTSSLRNMQIYRHTFK